MSARASNGAEARKGLSTFASPRRNLGEEVSSHLRKLLKSGAFAPGARLAIQEIAHDLGVSTMPVREALITLANEGLVDMLPRKGFRVSTVTEEDIRHTFLVHGYVAGLLAEAASQTIGNDDLATLRLIVDEFETISRLKTHGVERSAKLEELNFRFHRIINWASDSPRLRWFLRAGGHHLPRLPRHSYADLSGWTDAALSDHPGIVVALERRDDATVRKLVEQHVFRAGEIILRHLERTREARLHEAEDATEPAR